MPPSSDAEAVVSKAEFARLCRVSRGRVTQWCTEGKLTGEAFVGSGRTAQIRVAVARTQLKRRLDVDQRTSANGLNTRLGDAADLSGDAVVIEDKIKAERLESLRRGNRLGALEEAAAGGKYIRTDDVRLQMGRLATQMIASFDGAVGELATATAAKFGLAQRDVLHAMRAEYRVIREQMSAARRTAAQALPALVEDAG